LHFTNKQQVTAFQKNLKQMGIVSGETHGGCGLVRRFGAADFGRTASNRVSFHRLKEKTEPDALGFGAGLFPILKGAEGASEELG
jgi:hypothetical protein